MSESPARPPADQAELEQHIRKMVLHTASPGKHAARSALRHIDSAWKVHEIDPEGAVFHAITGEEEVASAIFHALRRRKYDGAGLLDPRNHIHKAAVRPFLEGVGEFLFRSAEKLNLQPHLRWHETKTTHKLQVPLLITGGPLAGKELLGQFPLQFEAKLNGRTYDFTKELAKVVTLQNAKSIEKHIRALANHRNRILYASAQGIPHIASSVTNALQRFHDLIFGQLTVFLLIDQNPNQLFVQQALNTYRALLRRLDPRLITR